MNNINKLTLGGLIVTLGIVYGDIGTSPLYVMNAILATAEPGSLQELVYGSISCIIWTLTLQTTVKYVFLTLRADNKGEGGIFSLYALIRKKKRRVYMLAIIGGSALIADGIITPSITIVSAVEGLKAYGADIPVVPIALTIITALFMFQQFGTKLLGKSFGPVMFFWFLTLGILGFKEIISHYEILKSFNPFYAYRLLTDYPGGFLLLGAVFLCTTGAEALYSDLGHCGLKNIRVSWAYVKTCLILNYLGQGVWILNHPGVSGKNPFFEIMPGYFHITGVMLATAAAVIASQALISGSYTIFSEAIPLNFFPRLKIVYPSDVKGQMYIPFVNWFLYLSCIFVVLFFQESVNMEAAYGLSITITMLMTSLLMTYYLKVRKKQSLPVIAAFLFTYMTIEGVFLVANLHKFRRGGWFTVLMAGLIFSVMFVWYKGREIKKRFTQFINISDYYQVMKDLQTDISVPKYATHLIYITRADNKHHIESKIMYSIINKQPKRADNYWFIHIHYVDDPDTAEYSVETLIPGVLIRVEFRLGFKINPRINLFFRQVVENMVKNKEIDILSHYPSLRKHNIPGDFRFVIIDRIQTYDFDFSPREQMIMDIYETVKKIGISDVKALGLDTSNVTVETVPLNVKPRDQVRLKRI